MTRFEGSVELELSTSFGRGDCIPGNDLVAVDCLMLKLRQSCSRLLTTADFVDPCSVPVSPGMSLMIARAVGCHLGSVLPDQLVKVRLQWSLVLLSEQSCFDSVQSPRASSWRLSEIARKIQMAATVVHFR